MSQGDLSSQSEHGNIPQYSTLSNTQTQSVTS